LAQRVHDEIPVSLVGRDERLAALDRVGRGAQGAQVGVGRPN